MPQTEAMSGPSPPPRAGRRFRRLHRLAGLLAAGLLAWLLCTLETYLQRLRGQLTPWEAPSPTGAERSRIILQNAELFFVEHWPDRLFFDLPVALALTFALGAPLWWLADRAGWGGVRTALALGAVAGLLIFLPWLAWLIWAVQAMSPDELALTPMGGWPANLLDMAELAIIGAVCGWAAWAVAGALDRRRTDF